MPLNSETFQGLAQKFKDFSRTSPKIQGLFKTVRTLNNNKENATHNLGLGLSVNAVQIELELRRNTQ